MSQDYPGYIHIGNLKLLEELHAKWVENPESVDSSWRYFFEGMQCGSPFTKVPLIEGEGSGLRVRSLIGAYRTLGHLMAKVNPLEKGAPKFLKELSLDRFGLSEKDLETPFPTFGLIPKEEAPLSEIVETLKRIYCGSIGIEYMNLGHPEMEEWIQKRIEPQFSTQLSDADRVEILEQLAQAEGFENFLQTKYVGQKRFSLEGGESLIPTLHALLKRGLKLQLTHVVMGMAHRGRLNVLAHILGKSFTQILGEFEGKNLHDLSEGSGDVKYHLGFETAYGEKDLIRVILSANPSHLESVDTIVEGAVRAIQRQKGEKADQKRVLPILIHGDAAVAGQGIVYEAMAMSQLEGYGTLGTIHIIINNQIGFTTSSEESRSTHYCTDLAKAFGAVVLHVNGEDPEACVAASQLAIEIRQQFSSDVFIDLIGYRKYGHNEGDEPTFTQPQMYGEIRAKQSVRLLYRNRLIQSNVLGSDRADQFDAQVRAKLDRALEVVKEKKESTAKGQRALEEGSLDTRVDIKKLISLGQRLNQIPGGIELHPKVAKLIKERGEIFEKDPNELLIDWGVGELLAYATLCTQGVHVRLSGQDVRRGTFSHRHACYIDQKTSSAYFPLSQLEEGQAPFDIFNSPLSEMGVLGFEFGYSLMYPKSLVIWEAQYGDFANGAQIIIDQYIVSSKAKWGQLTNLTLLLPHGYEGMGPEHSSARVERFLQQAALDNIIIANCTNPAQLFHLLRRQALSVSKRPLVIFTPKAILRHPLCRSTLNELANGQFREVLADPTPPNQAKRLFLCTGKIFYTLLEERQKRGGEDLLIRLEQLYPFDGKGLIDLIGPHSHLEICFFIQEEHENMGAWPFLAPQLKELFKGKMEVRYVGRGAAASTAAGSQALHIDEHKKLLSQLYPEGSTS